MRPDGVHPPQIMGDDRLVERLVGGHDRLLVGPLLGAGAGGAEHGEPGGKHERAYPVIHGYSPVGPSVCALASRASLHPTLRVMVSRAMRSAENG